jgi:hypothetical protein
MKKSFATVCVCAVIVAALLAGSLCAAPQKPVDFRRIGDSISDIMDIDAAKGYIREKWPLIRSVAEKCTALLDRMSDKIC